MTWMTCSAPKCRSRLAAVAARCPDPQMTAIGRVGSSPSGTASMSCQAPGHSAGHTSYIVTTQADGGSSPSATCSTPPRISHTPAGARRRTATQRPSRVPERASSTSWTDPRRSVSASTSETSPSAESPGIPRANLSGPREQPRRSCQRRAHKARPAYHPPSPSPITLVMTMSAAPVRTSERLRINRAAPG
jgi:hypothetical protein